MSPTPCYLVLKEQMSTQTIYTCMHIFNFMLNLPISFYENLPMSLNIMYRAFFDDFEFQQIIS